MKKGVVCSAQRLSIILSSGEISGILNKFAIPLDKDRSCTVLLLGTRAECHCFVFFGSVLKLLPQIAPP